MIISRFETPGFVDMHVHLRQPDGADLALHLSRHARHSDLVMAMPNTVPPLDNSEALRWYRAGLDRAWGSPTEGWVKLAFLFDPAMEREWLESIASTSGVVAAKVYPRGLTTHSSSGVPSREISLWKDKCLAYDDALGMLSEMGIVLCVHAESSLDDVSGMVYHAGLEGTESSWIGFLKDVTARFGKLRVVVEHVTTTAMAQWVANSDPKQVAATVTPQHLEWHLGHLVEGGLRPMRFCKPLYKLPRDREALWGYVLNRPNFFLGSDSAPHPRDGKLAECGCAGVYSAPVLAEVLAGLFHARGGLDSRFSDFTSARAREFYRLAGGLTTAPLVFEKSPFVHQNQTEHLPTAWDGARLEWSASRVVGRKKPDQPKEEAP